jgi:hypothetical protein
VFASTRIAGIAGAFTAIAEGRRVPFNLPPPRCDRRTRRRDDWDATASFTAGFRQGSDFDNNGQVGRVRQLIWLTAGGLPKAGMSRSVSSLVSELRAGSWASPSPCRARTKS